MTHKIHRNGINVVLRHSSLPTRIALSLWDLIEMAHPIIPVDQRTMTNIYAHTKVALDKVERNKKK